MPNQKSKLNRKHIIAGAIILALAFGFGAWAWTARDEQAGQVVQEGQDTQTQAPVVRDPLTGLPVAEAVTALPRVYAVMIDNSVDAWPQSGIDKAFLVIEAPVEAAIPRFEAFFEEGATVEKIGPVRSARPYFVDWTDEFDALYAHVGGSNEALALINSRGTFDLNEFSHGNSFWRAATRTAPHNAYTSTDLLAAAVTKAAEKGTAPNVLYGTWKFKDGETGTGGTNGTGALEVRFNSDLYAVDWTYDAATGTYLRSQGSKPTVTLDGVRIGANNVAVMVTDIEVVDDVGRRHARTTGEGKAWVLQDGNVIEATWKKPSVSERIAFYGTDGNEIAMNAGNTWIEVTGDEGNVEMTHL